VFPPGQDSLIPREAAARRPEWQDGAPIVMGDGQAWTLPRPSVRVVEQPDLHLQWLLGNTPAPEIGEWYASLPGPDAPEPSLAEKIAIHTTLAIALLIRNYDLTPAQAGYLVVGAFRARGDAIGHNALANEVHEKVVAAVAGDFHDALAELIRLKLRMN
jgi:hypothetical protein